jgi:hypothetical protein
VKRQTFSGDLGIFFCLLVSLLHYVLMTMCND